SSSLTTVLRCVPSRPLPISSLFPYTTLFRSKAVLFGGGLAAVVSLIFATQGGMFFLDAADYFINQFGVAMLGLVEVVLMAWILRKLRDFRTHADNISDIRLGWWWNVSLTIITPLVLGYMMYQLLVQNLTKQF